MMLRMTFFLLSFIPTLLLAQEFSCSAVDGAFAGEDDGIIVVNVLAGISPFSLQITGPSNDNYVVDQIGRFEFEGFLPGNYTVTVTDGNGGTEDCTLVVPEIIGQEINLDLCDCIQIGVAGEDCFFWNPVTDLVDPDLSSTSACPKTSGTYVLTILDDDNNITETREYYINVDEDLEISQGVPVLCGTSFFVELDAGSGYDSYTWNTGATTQELGVFNPGLYSVTVTKGTCESVKSINVYDGDLSKGCFEDYLESIDFYRYDCTVLQLPGLVATSDFEIEILGQVVDLGDELDAIINNLQGQGYTASGMITYANSFCDGEFEAFLDDFETSTNDVDIWFHLCDVEGSDEDYWYVKTRDFDLVGSALYSTAVLQNPPAGFTPLYKNDIKSYVSSTCGFTATHNCMGGFYELAFLEWGLLNFTLGGFAENEIIFPGVRPTKPDATSDRIAINGAGVTVPIPMGEWWEVKAKYGTVRPSTDRGQIRNHFVNLRTFAGIFAYNARVLQVDIVTTHDSAVSFGVFTVDKNISAEHLWGYKKINSLGVMEVTFGKWNDWEPAYWILGVDFAGFSPIPTVCGGDGCFGP